MWFDKAFALALPPAETEKQQKSFEEYLEIYGLTTGKQLTGERPSLSSEQWWQANITDRGIDDYSDYRKSFSQFWPDLNQSQKALPVPELMTMLQYHDYLRPYQCKSMTGPETVSHLNLIQLLDLQRSSSLQAFSMPDFKERALKQPQYLFESMSNALKIWPDLPSGYKKLDARALGNVALMWDRLSIENWQKVPAEAADAVAQAVRRLDLNTSSAEKHDNAEIMATK